MIFFGGRRLLGRVEEHSGSYVATEFAHAYFLPLVPIRSHAILTSGSGYRVRRVPIPLHGTSVLAGYVRGWGPVGTFVTLIMGLATEGPRAAIWGAASGLLALLSVWGWAALGKLGAEARAKRDAYAALTRAPVDAAYLCRATNEFRDALLASVTEGARGMMNAGYRLTLDPGKDWAKIALDPVVQDRAFLQACFTLSRIEWSRAEGARRGELAAQHDALWTKLRTLPLVSNLPVAPTGDAPLA